MGLYIVRKIMEMHHAKYGIQNTERGVLFWLKLPTEEEKRLIDEKMKQLPISDFHPGTGKAIRRTLLTGTSSIMGRSGAPAGKRCRTVIWKW